MPMRTRRSRLQRRADGQELVGDGDAVVRVLRRQHRVVEQRQSFGEPDRIVGVARLVDDRSHLRQLPGAVVRGLSGQADVQTTLQVGTLAAQFAQRAAYECEEHHPLVGDPQLVQPQTTGPDGSFRPYHGKLLLRRGLCGPHEQLAGDTKPAGGERRLGAHEQLRRLLGCDTRRPGPRHVSVHTASRAFGSVSRAISRHNDEAACHASPCETTRPVPNA